MGGDILPFPISAITTNVMTTRGKAAFRGEARFSARFWFTGALNTFGHVLSISSWMEAITLYGGGIGPPTRYGDGYEIDPSRPLVVPDPLVLLLGPNLV